MMRRTLPLTVALAALLAGSIAVAEEAAPSPWFSEVRFAAMKSVDLDSIGVGGSLNVYKWSDGRSLWLDGCPIYDGSSNVLGGAAGLSTEAKGLPGVEMILRPVLSVIDCAGVGGKWVDGRLTWMAYVTTQF